MAPYNGVGTLLNVLLCCWILDAVRPRRQYVYGGAPAGYPPRQVVTTYGASPNGEELDLNQQTHISGTNGDLPLIACASMARDEPAPEGSERA